MDINNKKTSGFQLVETDTTAQPTNLSGKLSATRRAFMAGLAAVLTTFRLPGVSAKEEEKIDLFTYQEGLIVDLEFEDDGEYVSPIEYLEVGECEDMLGGPAKESTITEVHFEFRIDENHEVWESCIWINSTIYWRSAIYGIGPMQ